MRRIITAVPKFVRDENSDLYLLTAAAFGFAVLGGVNLVNAAALSSITLAALGTLVVTQIRSRRQIAGLAREGRVLLDHFPDDLAARRAEARDFLFVGRTMSRTARTMDLRALLKSGARVRVLVIDPANTAAVEAAFRQGTATGGPALLARRIEAVLEELTSLRAETGGDLELRVLAFVPGLTLNVIDPVRRDGLICVQHAEYRPEGEPGPIIRLDPRDGVWFHRYAAQAERLWADGRPWPGAAA